MKISEAFIAEPTGHAPSWKGMPGWRDGEDRWCAAYSVEGDGDWGVGIAFASKRDAEICIMVLRQLGISPTTYHTMPDEDLDDVKREIMRNLLW